MTIVNMMPLRDLISLSEEDNIQTYIRLIGDDLSRHLSELEAGIMESDHSRRAKSLHGIYQVAASFGLTSVRQMTGVLREKNNVEPKSLLDGDDLEAIKTVIDESLNILQHSTSQV